MTTPAKPGRGWPLGIRGTVSTEIGRRAAARFVFLCVADEIAPAVLKELAVVATDADLDAWAERWRLHQPWIVSYARATLDGWRTYPQHHGATWFEDDSDGGGWTAAGTDVGGMHWYRDPAAYQWLARVHFAGESFAAIAAAAGREAPIVRGAVRALATLIDLPLRTRRRGRPRRV